MVTPRITCARRLSFDAAHRVLNHEGKCRYLHGHRYEAEASFVAETLDDIGRVIDFGVIKEKLGAWINAHWDHTTILWDRDKPLGEAISAITEQKIYYLPYNPTAENIARYLLETICPDLFKEEGIRCISMAVHETPSCTAWAQL